MLLARARQQELARLRIAVEAQRLVLFQDPVYGVAHAVLVVARLGLDGERDGRLRQFDRRIVDVHALVRQRVAGQRILQLGDRADIARVHLRHRLQRLAHAGRRCAPGVRPCRALTLCRLASFFTTPEITLK